MSSDYDPRQYGLVKLGPGAGSGPKEEPAAATPEDILFEEEAPSQPTAAAETSAVEDEDEDDGWGALQEPPVHVGSEEAFPVLSEPPAARPEPEPQPTEPVDAESELLFSEPEPAAQPVHRKPRPTSTAKGSAVRARLTPRPPRIPDHRLPPVRRPSGWMVPIVVFALSAGMGATMFLFFQNLPLACLALAMGVIGSLFTRVLLR